MMPVSSATSRTAACSGVSPSSRCPLGRHHSTRPARLRRAMTAAGGARGGDVDDEAPRGGLLDRGQDRCGPRGSARIAAGGACGHCKGPVRLFRSVASARRVRGRDGAGRSGRLDARARLDRHRPTPQARRTARWRPRPSRPVGARARRPVRRAGHELALVGGPVRDAFLGPRRRPTSTSPPTPAPTRPSRSSRGWADAHWDIGREFGTIGARKGAAASSRSRPTAPTPTTASSRKPVVAFGDTLEDDLRRRDFTVNAMARAAARR